MGLSSSVSDPTAVNQELIACALFYELTSSLGFIEKNRLLVGDSPEFEPTLFRWGFRSSHLVCFSQESYNLLLSFQKNKTKLNFLFRDKNFDGYVHTGSLFISNITLRAELGQFIQMNVDYQPTGTLNTERYNLIDGEDPLENRVDELGNNLVT